MAAGRVIRNRAVELHTPFLMLQGTHDRVVDVATNLDVARKASKFCTLAVFVGGYHELHNDLEREEVIATIIEWLRAQRLLPPAS